MTSQDYILNNHPIYKSFKVLDINGYQEEEIFPCIHDVKFLKLDNTVEQTTIDGNEIYNLIKKYTNYNVPEHFKDCEHIGFPFLDNDAY
jgi:hypothetical protein